MAARMETFGKALTAAERWQDATAKLYPTAAPAQRKSGPKGAFLGLCHAGMVKGVRAETGSVSSQLKRHGQYAVEAAEELAIGKRSSITELWAAVGGGAAHEYQMDVVLSLWNNGLLVSTP